MVGPDSLLGGGMADPDGIRYTMKKPCYNMIKNGSKNWRPAVLILSGLPPVMWKIYPVFGIAGLRG
jgi:hypothetical protein